MFTNNFYKVLNGIITGANASCIDIIGSTTTYNINNLTSDIRILSFMRTVRTSEPKNYANNQAGTAFGTGNKPSTTGDYWLSGDMVTTLASSTSATAESDETGVTYTCVYTLTNTGNDDVTISEIGLLGYDPILIERTVLESPITIEPGGVGQVTYTIRMNYPTV